MRRLRACSALNLSRRNLTVQRPVSGDVASFVATKSLDEYHQERGEQALAPARALLDADGLSYDAQQRVGLPGPTIAEVAQTLGCDLIVMASHGRRGVAALLLGSETSRVLTHSEIPVLVVK